MELRGELSFMCVVAVLALHIAAICLGGAPDTAASVDKACSADPKDWDCIFGRGYLASFSLDMFIFVGIIGACFFFLFVGVWEINDFDSFEKQYMVCCVFTTVMVILPVIIIPSTFNHPHDIGITKVDMNFFEDGNMDGHNYVGAWVCHLCCFIASISSLLFPCVIRD